MDTFRVTALDNSDKPRLTAYLQHDQMPLFLALVISVEGNVATWRGQAFWNGDEAVELDVYYPLLSRLRFDVPDRDRILVAKCSGLTLGPLSTLNYAESYIGSLSAPVLLSEGGGRGLAWVDENQSDYAADPSASAQRGQAVGNTFPPPGEPWGKLKVHGGSDGPFAGIRYTRHFRAIAANAESEYDKAEKPRKPLPVRKLGDAVDLGPVLTYAYAGSWKAGASWVRARRASLKFRVSPARWFQNTTFIAEDMGDAMIRRGQTFNDLSSVLAEKQRMGSDVVLLPGFHDPEILGTTNNWLNRGDYFFAAENLGGFEDARQGIRTLQRRGGHLLYYLEGLIVWKRSRIGEVSRDWALMNADGTYYESYKGFWHMCPAVKEWQDWLAQTAADIVRTTGVDGFFIDSLTATDSHRCYNPAHHHPQPDVWTWGVRQTLRRVREELDKVNPEAVVLVEGEADIAREYADGFVTHSQFWNGGNFTEPLVRFVHPDMRAYESWGYDKLPQKVLVWNAVNGHRIYAHNSETELMAPLSEHTRRYYDAFPEITENQMSALDAACKGCIAQVFEGRTTVITVGNTTAQPVQAALAVPVVGGVLFDRVDGTRLPILDGKARLQLGAWQFRAFEVRP